MLQSSASQNHKWGTYTGVLSGEHTTARFLNTSLTNYLVFRAYTHRIYNFQKNTESHFEKYQKRKMQKLF